MLSACTLLPLPHATATTTIFHHDEAFPYRSCHLSDSQCIYTRRGGTILSNVCFILIRHAVGTVIPSHICHLTPATLSSHVALGMAADDNGSKRKRALKVDAILTVLISQLFLRFTIES